MLKDAGETQPLIEILKAPSSQEMESHPDLKRSANAADAGRQSLTTQGINEHMPSCQGQTSARARADRRFRIENIRLHTLHETPKT